MKKNRKLSNEKESLSVRFLYQTKLGRFFLKILVHPWISKVAGIFLSSRFSRVIVPVFIERNQVDMTGYKKQKYQSFNEFFSRKRIDNNVDMNSESLISPCDAYLTAYPINKNSIYRIKHTDYSLKQLLENETLARQFAGGVCMMFRLTPKHYHRYCYICDGMVEKTKRIEGKLHCVRPVAYNAVPVFVENSREYTVINSNELGKVVQMEVGALLVGKIKNHPIKTKVFKGEEKGYFEFGGSTIMVLFEKGRIKINNNILESSRVGEETEVRLGMKIGKIQADVEK